jgi:RimJ/RimL family protein N-acetyltransferase
VPSASGVVQLAPLCASDADELVGLLAESDLRVWLRARDLEQLRRRFEGWEVRRSPDGREAWLNWVVRSREDGRALGWTQATVAKGAALVAYAMLPEERRRGYAAEALRAMIAELREQHGVIFFEAHIEETNVGSQRVAGAAGFKHTDQTVRGEAVWTLTLGT